MCRHTLQRELPATATSIGSLIIDDGGHNKSEGVSRRQRRRWRREEIDTSIVHCMSLTNSPPMCHYHLRLARLGRMKCFSEPLGEEDAQSFIMSHQVGCRERSSLRSVVACKPFDNRDFYFVLRLLLITVKGLHCTSLSPSTSERMQQAATTTTTTKKSANERESHCLRLAGKRAGGVERRRKLTLISAVNTKYNYFCLNALRLRRRFERRKSR
jgi:hypothetical protein